MFNKSVFRRGFSTATVIFQGSLHYEEAVCRPSDLPIYAPREESGKLRHSSEDQHQPEECFAYRRVLEDHLNDSVVDFDWLLTYLRKEHGGLPNVGAVGIGGLTGFIYGLGGGHIKKAICTTTGVLFMAAVCYPRHLYDCVTLSKWRSSLSDDAEIKG